MFCMRGGFGLQVNINGYQRMAVPGCSTVRCVRSGQNDERRAIAGAPPLTSRLLEGRESQNFC